MRFHLIGLAANVLFISSLAQAAGPGLEIAGAPAATAFRFKICSPFVPGGWRSDTIAPSTWSDADCGTFAASIGATKHQVGCAYSEAPAPGAQKFLLAPVSTRPTGDLDCGWSRAVASPNQFTAKLCSAVVPNGWRSVTLVRNSWSAGDCQNFAKTFNATHVQLGCVFSTAGADGKKFAWGRELVDVNAASTEALRHYPARDCEWRSTPTLAGGGTRVCSAIAPNAWRSAGVVIPTWTAADCQAYARAFNATRYQLGCLFELPPAGATEKFAFGQSQSIGRAATAANMAPNCPWR